MRARFVVLLGAIAVLAACDKSTTPVSPATTTDDVVDLIPDYAVSPAASIDAAGIGGSLLPDALKLTPEQKALKLLQDAVKNEALGSDFNIDWAAVLYDDKVLDKVDFSKPRPDRHKAIAETVDKHGPGGVSLVQLADGVTVDEVKAKTKAALTVSPSLKVA